MINKGDETFTIVQVNSLKIGVNSGESKWISAFGPSYVIASQGTLMINC